MTNNLLQPYIIEVQRLVPQPPGPPTFKWLGVIDKYIQPTLSQEIGMSDELTFNIQMSDPKLSIFADNNLSYLEVWLYGRDLQLKQMFVVSLVELSRDYGATAMSSGSGGLSAGSGDTVLITCTSIEDYLRRYIVRNYKVYQRTTSDIITDIAAEMIADGVVQGPQISSQFEMPLDIDLSWENVMTAMNNIIAQTGGYLYIATDSIGARYISIMSLPELIAQPIDSGMTSAILPA